MGSASTTQARAAGPDRSRVAAVPVGFSNTLVDVTPPARAVATAVLAALIAGTAWLGPGWLVLVLAALALLLAWSWGPLLDLPAPGAAAIVVGAGGLGAIGAGWGTDAEPYLRFVPLVIAMSLVLAFLAEMLRQDGRHDLVRSVSGTVTGAVLAAGLCGWIAAARTGPGLELAVAAAVSVAVGAAIRALPQLIGFRGAVATVLAGAAVGLGCAALLPQVTLLAGLVAGAAACFGVAVAIAVLPNPVRTAPQTLRPVWRGLAAAAAAPAAAGALVYPVGRLLLG